ncbi:hypothetical protein [Natronobacterium texcoconense]|uniref:Uncharacterized protein n=1 Tax=Natronobacterium texcoconense TaxID=1095778 RepID=A0A1H0YTN3_NATTX|nr:hypothetical protein [Natronobacterium texcoconense]SDQ18534.1 hypothetical protein SAMN04489842_0001 [Natronobacterium texcoconense]
MNVPTDRLLVMLVVATGFAVLVGGWAGGLVHAEVTGWEELALRGSIGLAFFFILFGLWQLFDRMDEGSSDEQ